MAARAVLAWIAKAAAVLFVAGIASLVAVLLLMRREHGTRIELPTPTGHFKVGRTTFAWSNEGEVDELAPMPGTRRQVLAWVWYPAASSSNAVPADYLPAAWRAALAAHQGLFMRSLFKHDPAVVQPHSLSEAPLSPEQQMYPVVLLRSGGSALTTDFTTLAEDLASHGYFVVGFDAPYRSFVAVLSDGRVASRSPAYTVENANGNLGDPIVGKLLAMWISDTRFVVDQLERLNEEPSGRFRRRIDLNRLGMFGHSFGGATAFQFCHDDSRCKAALDLDGIPFGSVVNDGLAKSGMFLLSDHRGEADRSSGQILAEIQSIYDRLTGVRLYAVIRGSNHFSFSDQILLNSQVATRLLRAAVRFGPLDGRRGLAITADYVHTFFDVSLNGSPSDMLTRLSARYPEVEILGAPNHH